GMAVGAPVLAVAAAPWSAPWGVLGGSVEFGRGTAPVWALAVWVIVVSTVIAYVLGGLAMRFLDAQLAAAICYTEAVATIVIAWLALGERLTVLQLAGGAIVLTGAYLAQRPAPAATAPLQMTAA
ncbi:EamA family transporter, partial [Actinocorallia lasiicapitis]